MQSNKYDIRYIVASVLCILIQMILSFGLTYIIGSNDPSNAHTFTSDLRSSIINIFIGLILTVWSNKIAIRPILRLGIIYIINIGSFLLSLCFSSIPIGDVEIVMIILGTLNFVVFLISFFIVNKIFKLSKF